MDLTPEAIQRVAALAALTVLPSEIPAVTAKLSQILELVNQINSFDTTGIEPMAHPFAGLEQPCRDDTVTQVNEREALLANAPKTEAGLFLVPQVIE